MRRGVSCQVLARRTQAELTKHDALDAYLTLARGADGRWALAAVEAIGAWLVEEPWKVGTCTYPNFDLTDR
jgi:hypothetical protein